MLSCELILLTYFYARVYIQTCHASRCLTQHICLNCIIIHLDYYYIGFSFLVFLDFSSTMLNGALLLNKYLSICIYTSMVLYTSAGSKKKCFSQLKIVRTDWRVNPLCETHDWLMHINVRGINLVNFDPRSAVERWWISSCDSSALSCTAPPKT